MGLDPEQRPDVSRVIWSVRLAAGAALVVVVGLRTLLSTFPDHREQDLGSLAVTLGIASALLGVPIERLLERFNR